MLLIKAALKIIRTMPKGKKTKQTADVLNERTKKTKSLLDAKQTDTPVEKMRRRSNICDDHTAEFRFEHPEAATIYGVNSDIMSANCGMWDISETKSIEVGDSSMTSVAMLMALLIIHETDVSTSNFDPLTIRIIQMMGLLIAPTGLQVISDTLNCMDLTPQIAVYSALINECYYMMQSDNHIAVSSKQDLINIITESMNGARRRNLHLYEMTGFARTLYISTMQSVPMQSAHMIQPRACPTQTYVFTDNTLRWATTPSPCPPFVFNDS